MTKERERELDAYFEQLDRERGSLSQIYQRVGRSCSSFLVDTKREGGERAEGRSLLARSAVQKASARAQRSECGQRRRVSGARRFAEESLRLRVLSGGLVVDCLLEQTRQITSCSDGLQDRCSPGRAHSPACSRLRAERSARNPRSCSRIPSRPARTTPANPPTHHTLTQHPYGRIHRLLAKRTAEPSDPMRHTHNKHIHHVVVLTRFLEIVRHFVHLQLMLCKYSYTLKVHRLGCSLNCANTCSHSIRYLLSTQPISNTEDIEYICCIVRAAASTRQDITINCFA